jgi:hypothetical protein
MMTTLYIVLILIFVFGLGLFRIFKDKKNIDNKITFLREYRDKYSKLGKSYFKNDYKRVIDKKLYDWLLSNASQAQREVDLHVKVDSPRNYQLIINSLSEFRENTELNLLENNRLKRDIDYVDFMLGLSIGKLLDSKESIYKKLKNPIKWFQYGVRFLVALPMRFLEWFGIINEPRFESIIESWFFKFVSTLIALIGFFGSIVTIVTGWEAFKKIIQNWLN